MHPILFEFSGITIYSYGTFIALGAMLGYFFTTWRAKKELNLSSDKVTDLLIFVIISAVIGGRFFVFFENPSYYFGNPSNMFKLSSRGFVFYGSLIFAIPTMIFFFRRNKIPTFQMLDIMAFTGLIVHAFGRLGCFMAGCCYGHTHDGWLSVVFTDPKCAAEPLNTPLYPTQLFSAGMLFIIFGILWLLKKRQKFHGQLFLIYVAMYALGRSIVEVYRGDLERGFVIKDVLSNSQFISIILIVAVIYFYLRLSKNTKLQIR
jgi:phosphatidylglycerol:prolipoprotein diacylglycerol transferase